jgi:hypothetical protein
LGDGVFRAGAFEGLGLYALAGLATANDVSALSGNGRLTRESNTYSGADSIQLLSVMPKLLRDIHRIRPSLAVVSALGEEYVTSPFPRTIDLLLSSSRSGGHYSSSWL